MLVKNSIIFAATMVIKGALSFLLIATFTRLLTADAYGDYAIIIAIVSFADVLGFAWIRFAVMRHITDEETSDDKTYLTNSLLIYAIISIAALLLSALLSITGIIDAQSQKLLYQLLGLIIAAEAISNIAILMARLRLRLGLFITLSIAKPLLTLAIGVFLIIGGYGVQGAVWALLASYALAAAAGLLALPDFRKIKASLIDRQTIKSILAFGLPLIAALSIQSAVQATDRILLETLIGGDITGLYAAAQDIPQKLLTIIISGVHLAAYPLAVKALETNGEDECRKQLSANCVLLAGVLFPATLAIALLTPQLSAIFLGEEFRPFANTYFPVFAAIGALNCIIQYYFILAFNLAKQTKLMIIPFCTALTINAGIGFYLIPTMAEQGAIWGSFLAYLSLLIASIVIGLRIFPMPIPRRELAKIITATLIMGLTLWSVDLGTGLLSLLLYTVLGAITYGVAILALNPMNARQYIVRTVK